MANLVGEENVNLLIDNAIEVNDKKVIIGEYQDVDNKTLNNLGKNITKKAKDTIAFLASTTENGINFVVFAGAGVGDLHIGKIIKELLAEVGGKGGGSKDAANGFIPSDTIALTDLIEQFKAKI